MFLNFYCSSRWVQFLLSFGLLGLFSELFDFGGLLGSRMVRVSYMAETE